MTLVKKTVLSPTSIFLMVSVCYVLLLSLTSILDWGILKALSYVAALVIFMIMFFVWANAPKLKTYMPEFYFALGAYYTGLACSLVLNHTHLDYSVILKLVLAPAFFVFGANFVLQKQEPEFKNFIVKVFFIVMILAPLFVLVIQQLKNVVGLGAGADFSLIGAGKEFSIFPNKNNAALYAVTLLAFYNVLAGKPLKNVLIIMAVGIGFGTLGVFIAIFFSLMLCTGRMKLLTLFIPALMVVFGVYTFYPDLIIFSRITPVIDSAKLLWNGSIDLSTVTYGELVRRLNTTDLSFLFRLKHWLDLLDIYMSGSAYQWIFGFGIGSSVMLSDMHLVPHNDYLRFLFECGLLTFLSFVALMFFIVRSLGRSWDAIPILTIVFYFLTENLVNNYLAMAIFYFCAGALIARLRSEKLQLKASNFSYRSS